MTAFEYRLAERKDELEWLYMELYDDRSRQSYEVIADSLLRNQKYSGHTH